MLVRNGLQREPTLSREEAYRLQSALSFPVWFFFFRVESLMGSVVCPPVPMSFRCALSLFNLCVYYLLLSCLSVRLFHCAILGSVYDLFLSHSAWVTVHVCASRPSLPPCTHRWLSSLRCRPVVLWRLRCLSASFFSPSCTILRPLSFYFFATWASVVPVLIVCLCLVISMLGAR